MQAVFEVYRPFYLVGRYEHFEPPSPQSALNLVTLGGVWKPFPFMAAQGSNTASPTTEFEDEDPAGFFSSFTTFF